MERRRYVDRGFSKGFDTINVRWSTISDLCRGVGTMVESVADGGTVPQVVIVPDVVVVPDVVSVPPVAGASELDIVGPDGTLPQEDRGFRKWLWRSAKRVRGGFYWLWNGGPPDDDFEYIGALLQKRNKALTAAMTDLTASFENSGPHIDSKLVFQLAAVDLFVEKAQAVLTARARRMSRAGLAASAAAVAALAGLSFYIVQHANLLSQGETPQLNTLILQIVTAISLGAVVLVAVKYLISLARSFFHESVTLLSRRHALRFGRMYLYLNASKNSSELDLKELRKAFDWNRGGDSSFLDIKPGEIGTTPWSILAKSVGDAVEKALEKAAEKGSEKLVNGQDAKGADQGHDAGSTKQAGSAPP